MIPWYARPDSRNWRCEPAPAEVAAFHAGLPGYAPTPLVELPELAAELGVGRLFVKDESARLGLPAFKILGASLAVFRLLSRLVDGSVASPDELRERLAGGPAFELVTATDGNHGRAVARMAGLLGLPSHVLVPELVGDAAREAIAAEGARLTVVAGDYDETVARAAELADADQARLLVQDTAWPGYEDVPRWIVDGYSTLFREVDAQLAAAGADPMGLLAVPVGVGSLAQAAVTHVRSTPGRCTLLGVEPTAAACVLASLDAGRLTTIETGHTIMAGLNCGTPSSIAWPVLRDGMDAAVAVDDDAVSTAVADLGRLGVPSGPSGAATLAGVRAALADANGGRRTALAVGSNATVVLLSTEAPPG